MVASKNDKDVLIGTTFGDHEVLGLIGQGATGAVYLARDKRLNRYVALKTLRPSLARDAAVVKRFHREAQVAAPLKHPNIMRVYSAGAQDGAPYIVMKFVNGEPLDRFLARRGRISWQSALHVAGQIAAALECAHGHGVIHRDVKPGNMILDRHGNVRLTDFGIANAAGDEGSALKTGWFVGTPQFMSPEQCAGRELAASTDLFSLGVMVYQMIAGHLPFEAESPVELIKLISTEDPPRLNKIVEDVPDDVARFVAHLLEKQPENRPENARAVLKTVDRIQRQKGGCSAWPMALSTFVREQGDLASLAFLARTPEPAYTPTEKTSPPRRPAKRTRRSIWAAAAALALA